MTAKERKAQEAEKMAQGLELLGYKAIYGGSKGHGFWIQGKGWRSMESLMSTILLMW